MPKNQQQGFTMIEILVVLFIIGVLSTLVLANYRGGQKQYALSQAAQQLISDLRRTQNMAMSGVEIAGVCDELNFCDGYGIYAEKDENFYIIYADQNGNHKYEPVNPLVETINLPDKITISSVSPLPNKVDLFFESPEPVTYINGNDAAGKTGAITLEFQGAGLTKTVTITTAGLIQ